MGKDNIRGRGGYHQRRGGRGGGRSPNFGNLVHSIDMEGQSASKTEFTEENSEIVRNFAQLQKDLDQKNDKYENLVKKSRDVTIESKRIIFALHRILRKEVAPEALVECDGRIQALRKDTLRKIAEELIGEDQHLFSRPISMGLQEFIEALSFYIYVKEERLVTWAEVQSLLTYEINVPHADETGPNSAPTKFFIHVSANNYILGLADLTGELMRRCINSVGAGLTEEPFTLCCFLRAVYEEFISIGNHGDHELRRKISTLKQSLDKVEAACYALRVRGSEMPQFMLFDHVSQRHYVVSGDMEPFGENYGKDEDTEYGSMIQISDYD